MKLAYRISRGPFWVIFAVLVIINIALEATMDGSELPLVFLMVWLLLVAIAWLLVSAGRLRDMGSSPWASLLVLVPLVGFVMVLWLGFSASKTADIAESTDSAESTK